MLKNKTKKRDGTEASDKWLTKFANDRDDYYARENMVGRLLRAYSGQMRSLFEAMDRFGLKTPPIMFSRNSVWRKNADWDAPTIVILVTEETDLVKGEIVVFTANTPGLMKLHAALLDKTSDLLITDKQVITSINDKITFREESIPELLFHIEKLLEATR